MHVPACHAMCGREYGNPTTVRQCVFLDFPVFPASGNETEGVADVRVERYFPSVASVSQSDIHAVKSGEMQTVQAYTIFGWCIF